MTAKKSSKSPRTGGLPGSDYFQRIGEAWLAAAANHTAVINRMWDEARAGHFDHATALQTLAQTADGYFDAAIEASRGPGFVQQPMWVYIDFTPGAADGSTKDDPESLEAQVKLSRTEGQSVQPRPTPFAPMEADKPLREIYDFCDWVDGSRSRILIKLNKDKLKAAIAKDGAYGQYISFVLPGGRTGEPPLAIVMLRVNVHPPPSP